MMKKYIVSTLLAAIAGSTSLFADAIPYPAAGTEAPASILTVASASDPVVAYFHDGPGWNEDQLFFFVNGQRIGEDSTFFDNKSSNFGNSINLGLFNAGDILTLVLHSVTSDQDLSSDPSQNEGGHNYAYATSYSGEIRDGVQIPAGAFVGFEDVDYTASDWNYLDESVVLTNVTMASSSAAPEPGSVLLLGMGLAALGICMRKKRRTL